MRTYLERNVFKPFKTSKDFSYFLSGNIGHFLSNIFLSCPFDIHIIAICACIMTADGLTKRKGNNYQLLLFLSLDEAHLE